MAAEDEDWNPFVDPADSAPAGIKVGGCKPKRRKPAEFAFPFPESESDDSATSDTTGEAPLAWSDDPALEALSGSLGGVLRAQQQPKGPPLCTEAVSDGEEDSDEQGETEEDHAVVIDDADLGPRTERLVRGLQKSDFDEFEVFGDVLPGGELRDLALQACVISQACFVGGGTFRLVEGKHLALLVSTLRCVTLGYCLYSITNQRRTWHIEEIAVAEAHRHRGHGTALLRWALASARIERCSVVSVRSSSSLERLLKPLGFKAVATVEFSGPSGRPERDEHVRWEFGVQKSQCALDGRGAVERPHRTDTAEFSQRGVGAFLSGLRLVCFLASHISSTERLERLGDTLMSIALQEPYGPPELFMSWSASNEEFRDQTRALLKHLAPKLPGLHASEQQGQLSQFLHHAVALRRAGADLREDGWVFFSDDDDLWHPRRYFEFLCAVSEVHDTNVKSVAAFGHAQLRLNVEPRAVQPRDVDKLLLQGPLVCGLTDAERKATDIPEYFDVAVRNEQFKNFLLRTPRAILASKFCDRRFVLQFSVKGWGVAWFRPLSWLYFYSRADGITVAVEGAYKGGASFAVQVTELDRRLVERHERARRLAGEHPVSRLGTEEVAFLTASFRSSIEEQVITLETLDRACVKADQLRTACEMAVQSRAGISEEDARLWSWGMALAWDVAREVCSAISAQIAE